MTNNMNYIIASAGTGKTESIVNRIEKLVINEKIDISNIALITFTNKATKEMRERLRQKLYEKWEEGVEIRDQLDKINMVRISTIHSFCDDIIREYGLKIGISPNYKINSFNYETNIIVDSVIEENYDIEICSKIPTYIIKDILKSFYKETKDKGVVFELEQNKEITFWDKFRKYFYKLYTQLCERVEKEKRNKNVLTNNDLLYYAAKLVEDNAVLTNIAENLQFMFVDECQDINLDQMHIFETLMKCVSLTIVGDEKQSIYAFRGSDKRAFKSLIEKMNQNNAVKTLSDTNFRSNDQLIQVFNKIFNSKFRYQRTKLNFENIPLKCNGKRAGVDEVFEIIYHEPITDIVKNLAVKLENQEIACYNKITILCRTNKEVNQVVNELKSNGVDAEIYSSKSIYKSKSIVDLCKVLKYLITDNEIDGRELFYTDYYLASIKYFNETYLQEILDGLKFEIRNESISYILNRLTETTKIIDYYDSLGKEQYIANLNRLKEVFRELLSEGLSNIQIVDYLNTMIDTQQMEQEPETVTKAPVIVSTIHTYKGLSADIIILYNADRNLYRASSPLYEYDVPTKTICFNKNAMVLSNYSIPEDKHFEDIRYKQLIENLEEELRLLYVACTRAKEKLILATNSNESRIAYIIRNNPDYVSYYRWVIESNL